MKSNNDFSFVRNCGELECTIIKVNDIYHVGYFVGTYNEVKAALIKEYKGYDLYYEYLEKLNLLRDGGEPIEEFDWENDSWFIAVRCPEIIKKYPNEFNWKYSSDSIAEFCPELIKKFKDKFNWKRASWSLTQYCPELIKEYLEEFNWEESSEDIAKNCPELIKEFPRKFNWGEDSFIVEKYCPEYLQYRPEDI